MQVATSEVSIEREIHQIAFGDFRATFPSVSVRKKSTFEWQFSFNELAEHINGATNWQHGPGIQFSSGSWPIWLFPPKVTGWLGLGWRYLPQNHCYEISALAYDVATEKELGGLQTLPVAPGEHIGVKIKFDKKTGKFHLIVSCQSSDEVIFKSVDGKSPVKETSFVFYENSVAHIDMEVEVMKRFL